MAEIDKKREQIIESAIRRFSHFGVQKTTMNEIADDIAVSQPSLYYYFPDKTSIIVAVVEKVSNDYFEELEKILAETECLKDIFFQIIEFRRNFVKKFFMMHLTDSSADAIIRDNCDEILQESRLREIKIVAGILNSAIEKGEIAEIDAENVSAIYLDSLTGLCMWIISKNQKNIFPESKHWDAMVARQRELAEIFLKSLKYKDRSTCKV
ncbi:TetR/AcrR family transcriptional regulator [Pararcticibacter amylolyticus]|uniref:TetR/AcrR family transcriptional regulator n=1 Tax=Pararcticibacter amylolyticus TaxID=2173175 RepID=A0A2U2PF68_9SPHI|nr:TetR/AcrR family transcriptional regulator [Pararcticibacter amylolyticus]PWG80036.1 TetR/AcrR family transcriptional regulator [Pararcticibacter amylolyticus]